MVADWLSKRRRSKHYRKDPWVDVGVRRVLMRVNRRVENQVVQIISPVMKEDP